MAQYETYAQEIMAEDVHDEVYIISPVDNPVCSMSRSIRATARTHQWSEDKLRNVKQNKAVEGADAPATVVKNVVPLENYCQIFTETVEVTGTIEAVDKYGRDSEMAYQLELGYGALGNDEEAAVMGSFYATTGAPGSAQAGAVGDASTAREMKALVTQLDASVVTDASGAASVAALETLLLSTHGTVYSAGGNPGYLLTAPTFAANIGNMAYAAGRGRDIRNERRLINVIDLYVSYYGELDVVLDRNIVAIDTDGNIDPVDLGNYSLIDFNYAATPVLRPTTDWAIAKSGDADERQILRESTFAVLNTKAHGVLTGVSSASLPLT